MLTMLEKKLEDLYQEVLSKYVELTRRSGKLYRKGIEVFPQGVSYSIRYFDPYPIYVHKAHGCKLWDVDGNEYTDYWLGHGALILGHTSRPIINAVKEQLERGTHFGFCHELEIEFAKTIMKHLPSVEMIRFTNSGTEANMYATRLARAYTRRKFIVKVLGGWHGSYDALHVKVTPPFDKPDTAGLLEETTKYTLTINFNSVSDVEKVFQVYGSDVACVIVEPVLGAGGAIPARREFLKVLREYCDKYGALLIFDEVITGFRVSLGGAQRLYNVYPDLTVLGKVIGGGFPIGAFGGKREVMELIDERKCQDKSLRVFHGGTFTANPISLTAGLKVINILEEENPYMKFEEMTSKVIEEGNSLASRYNINMFFTGISSIIGIHFTSKKPESAIEAYESRWSFLIYKLFHKYCITSKIIYMTEKMPHLLLSTQHTWKDVEYLLNIIEDFIRRLSSILRT